ncbi:hypothetical protein KBZ20_01935 [Vulcanococcus limneticus Candia 3F8]|uniref:hypothetical protein n=1 Tax=Vulcanococcus limneticus TaxID=2170428 RepID=UPI000B98ACA2|nr:hypothetical protein [Vulcanococcus limneticus]MCP9790457.1 hypothetical protein [Vulcanococcus limneticus MW73D5]MCP9892536.1 hypothetical protein [Vulcanococcus limneticus Candia 3F8]MCP9896064.1 hypothetical protein [Vulcanococcus limneticus Candia 3B3]
MVDPLLMAELVLALLIVATLDRPRRPVETPKNTTPAPDQADPGWSAETDLHAQRILRLERRAGQ